MHTNKPVPRRLPLLMFLILTTLLQFALAKQDFSRVIMDKPLGVYCLRAGVTVDSLIYENPPRLEAQQLTNGLVLELYKYCSTKQIDKKHLTAWVLALVPEEQFKDTMNEDQYKLRLLSAINRVHTSKDVLRRKKKKEQIERLSSTVFVIPKDETTDNTRSTPEQASSVANYPSQSTNDDIPLDESQKSKKSKNLLEYQISVLKNKKEQYTAKIRRAKLDLQVLEAKQGHYSPHNVRRREARLKKRLNEKDVLCSTLQEQVTQLSDQRKIDSMRCEMLEKKVSSLTKLKWWHKNKHSEAADLTVEKRNRDLHKLAMKEKNCEIEQLEDENNQLKEGRFVNSVTDQGVYTDSMRECVVDLVSQEVATNLVGPVIESVGHHIYGQAQGKVPVPQRQSVLNIIDESQYLLKKYYTERLKIAGSWGLQKDGTSRQRVKILDTSMTLDDGEVLPLGFTAVSSETSDKIQETTVSELVDLAAYTHDEHFLSELCSKLTFFMSDRAANEKLANKKIEEWREGVLDAQTPQNRSKVHHFFCMAHVLLGFHANGVKEVLKCQREIEADNCFFGRDGNGAYARFGREAVCCRTPRMVSEIIGPVGDEKNGVADKWRAYCSARGIKSVIMPYKDNRFNAVFDSPARTLHHKQQICDLLSTITSPNLKLKSVYLDLQDPKVEAILCVFAVVGQKLTTPYWEMVKSDSCHYLDLSEPIQKMYTTICRWIEDPRALFDPEEYPVFEQFPPNKDALFHSSFRQMEGDMLELAMRIARSLLGGLKQTCEKQLVDFLPDGVYSKPATEEEKRLTHSTLTNLSCERHFGSLDCSQRKRKNATLHYHTAVLLLKAQGKNMLQWLRENEDRAELWSEARRMGKTIREAQKKNEKKVLEEIEANQEKKAKEQKKKENNRNSKDAGPKRKVPSEKRTPNRQKADKISHIDVGDWLCVAYDDRWHIGKVLTMSGNNPEVDFLQHGRHPGTFKRPVRPDVAVVEHRFVLAHIPPPTEVSNGRLFKIHNHDNLDRAYVAYNWM